MDRTSAEANRYVCHNRLSVSIGESDDRRGRELGYHEGSIARRRILALEIKIFAIATRMRLGGKITFKASASARGASKAGGQ